MKTLIFDLMDHLKKEGPEAEAEAEKVVRGFIASPQNKNPDEDQIPISKPELVQGEESDREGFKVVSREVESIW